ncbi:biotin transporter BioY [Nocardioides acrostichi]|uniref:Biotin transporter n=1 Tax=Nocardioides acrostichi TaxID=2784339 RepID=A0A930UT73_9ACTN|nr:biotin transporter BioY [Nocardioides acrostichi]MBF4160393.1 biotin transporter BioY [Nocardioides acrostichi]
MTMTAPSETAPSSRPGFSPTDLALVAAFAALIAACSVVGGIPVGGGAVDITLQTFGVLLTGAVLGPTRGFLAGALYLGIGAVGLPVFAGHSGGLAPFTSSSAGYLISFPFAAALTGLVVAAVGARRTRAWAVFLAAVAGMVLNHACGIVGMKLYFGVGWATAAAYDAPFWFVDVAKDLLVAIVAAEVHRAFPRLLSRR